MNGSVLTVTQLNKYIKSIIDGDSNLSNCFVEGEISNFKNHYSSGHFYFSIKDDISVLKCVMFSRSASRVKFKPADGMQVILRGKVSIYERDGQYQLYVEDMQPLGIGALAIRYEQLKEKLQKEGLFDIASKRSLPEEIKRIAVVTAETGAAIQDILSIANRRNPAVEMIVCPVIVQGENAAESMVEMLDRIYETSGIDVIIIGRGGGSFEDLFCFNDEELLRKIYEAPVPVISAVGHETDFTLCDFVADIRAATPSAAAELAVKSVVELKGRALYLKERLIESAHRCVDLSAERFDRCLSSRKLYNPIEYLNERNNELFSLVSSLKKASHSSFSNYEKSFAVALKALSALNPASVLMRGYSVATKEGAVIRSNNQLFEGDVIHIQFSDGCADCEVKALNGG